MSEAAYSKINYATEETTPSAPTITESTSVLLKPRVTRRGKNTKYLQLLSTTKMPEKIKVVVLNFHYAKGKGKVIRNRFSMAHLEFALGRVLRFHHR